MVVCVCDGSVWEHVHESHALKTTHTIQYKTHTHTRTFTNAHIKAYLAPNDDIDGTFQDDIPAVTLVPLVEHYSKRGEREADEEHVQIQATCTSVYTVPAALHTAAQVTYKTFPPSGNVPVAHTQQSVS